MIDIQALADDLAAYPALRRRGAVRAVEPSALRLSGLVARARIGDRVTLPEAPGPRGGPMRPELGGEIVALDGDEAVAMTWGPTDGIGVGDVAYLTPESGPRVSEGWIGRIVDAFGDPLDGRPLGGGGRPAPLRRAPPAPATRRALGPRLATGLSAFDTLLPLARGQRIGVFAGSGVGKSMLLADLARGVEADVVVYALIGERGRELRWFAEEALGAAGLARSVVVAATSDQPALVKRRAAWTAMAAAEAFRDRGAHVLLLVDSVTRFAEAHREVALTAGETPSLRAYPPSTAHQIAALCERAGPGEDRAGAGDITAIFSVLVAGSDMEEPVADVTRGVLDGHIVLDRDIAERGRFPAIDARRSVSRSLPGVAAPEENALIARARRMIGLRETAAPMLRAGLHRPGADAALDAAVRAHEPMERFLAAPSRSPAEAFERLSGLLDAADAGGSGAGGGRAGNGERAP